MASYQWNEQWKKLTDRLITVSSVGTAALGLGASIGCINALTAMGMSKGIVVMGATSAALATFAGAGYVSLKMIDNYLEKKKDKDIKERVDKFIKIAPQYKGQEDKLFEWEKTQLVMERPFTLDSLTSQAKSYLQSLAEKGEDFEPPFTGKSLADIKIVEQEAPYSFQTSLKTINQTLSEKNELLEVLKDDKDIAYNDKELCRFIQKVQSAERETPKEDRLTVKERASLYYIYRDNYNSMDMDSVNLCDRKVIAEYQKLVDEFKAYIPQKLTVDNKYIEILENTSSKSQLLRKSCEINFGDQTYYISEAKVKPLDNGTTEITFSPQHCVIDPIARFRNDTDMANEIGVKKASAFCLFSLQNEANQHSPQGLVMTKEDANIVEIGLPDCTGKMLRHGDVIFDRIDGSFGVIDASKDKDKFNDTPTFINLYDMKEKPLTCPFTSHCQVLCSLYEIKDKAYSFMQNLRVEGKESNLDLVLKRIDTQALELRDNPKVNLCNKLIHTIDKSNELSI